MPTYEYRCPEGHDFERFFRSMSAAEIQVACPECGKIAERRMSAGAGLLFTGSGFYLTDYGKNAHRGSGATPKSEGSTSSGGESSASATPAAPASEAKPAAKSESKPAATESKPKPKSDK